MGRSFRDEGIDADAAARAACPRGRAARSRIGRSALALVCLLLVGLATGASASAAGGSEHAFEKSFTGEGKCAFTEPAAVAVNDKTGEVYVVDREKHRVDRFSSTGACLGGWSVLAPEAIAVDNSNGPLAGDVYVSGAAEKESEERVVVRRYNSEGKLEHVIKRFRINGEEKPAEFEEFVERGEIFGLSVDASGSLWVYGGFGEAIYHFEGDETNTFNSLLEVPIFCSGRPGFAVASNGESFYAARERENHKEECEEPTVMVKLNASGEPVNETASKSQLDNENTTGVAVDQNSEQVYFDNVTSVSSFDSTGLFVQRFANEAGPGQLHEGIGAAVNAATNTVYAVDAVEGKVNVYGPSTKTPVPPEPTHELPDGRKYEMVSPPNKLGGSIYPITKGFGIVQAAADGSGITYTSNEPIVSNPPINRAPEPSVNVSRRGPSSWGTEAIGTPHPEVPSGFIPETGTEYEFFKPDLSAAFVDPLVRGFFRVPAPPLAPEAGEGTPYLRTLETPSSGCEPTPSPCYQALVSPKTESSGVPFQGKLGFATATPDGRHAIVQSTVKLTTEATQDEGLYEWEQTGSPGGALRLVSILPEGEAGPAEAPALGAPSNGGALASGVFRNAISNDGSRVIWSANHNADTTGALYLRDVPDGKTLRLDKSQGGPPSEVSGAKFQAASTDGSKVFFTDTQPLTANSTTEAENEEREQETALGDLYVCEIVVEGGTPKCNLTDLTATVVAANETAAVQGVVGASEDGSYVYFVANGALTPDAGPGHCEPGEDPFKAFEKVHEGALAAVSCGLYVAHLSGEKWADRLVSTLTNADVPDWAVHQSGGGLRVLTARVSPNGRFLAFMSDSPLTGYNNVDATSGKRDEEVFLYDANTTVLNCPSCNPTGEPPHGVLDQERSGEGIGLLIDRPLTWQTAWLAAALPGWTPLSIETALYQSRYLDNSGRLLFDGIDKLVPADTNGKSDVYQYEPNGQGSCASATGCVSLLSGGTSPQESTFLDASTTGDSVFLLTSQQLVSALDKDTGFDIYDARVCSTESPCQVPPGEPPPPCASEEACKGPAATVPASPGAPASTLAGSGNAGKVVVLSNSTGKPRPRTPTKAELLKKALQKCKKQFKKKKKRVACERQARKKYGTVKKTAKKSSHGRSKGARR